MGRVKDITGQRFGRLTVVCGNGLNKHKQYTWRAQCDCGCEVNVIGSRLRSGLTQSCGCLRSERIREYHANEDVKADYSKRLKERNTDPEFAELRNEAGTRNLREFWSRPDSRQRHMEGIKKRENNSEYVERRKKDRREFLRNLHEDPEFARSHNERMRERMRDPGFRHKISEARLLAHEYRAFMRRLAQEAAEAGEVFDDTPA